MKRLVLLLPLLLLFSGARAQQQLGTPVVCDVSSGLACLPSIQVGTGTSGMPAWESFGTLNTNTNIFNADFGQIYGMFGQSSHLIQTGSANASDIVGLWSGLCSSTTPLLGNGACGQLLVPPYYARTLAEISAGVCSSGCALTYPSGNVLRYGATGNGTTDDTTALANAALVGIPLSFPPGTYKTSATLAFTNSLFGQNAKATLISSTNLTASTATIQGQNLDVTNITFTHASTPTSGSGANGLNILAGSYQVNVNQDVANFDDNGIEVLAGSSALWLTRNNTSNNASAGFLLQNPNYFVRGNVSTANGGFGYQMTINGAQGAGLQLSDNLSYNNAGGGYSFVGSGSSGGATSLDDVLASNNISSFDEGNGWFFDTHGINFQLSNNYTEYCGYVPAGTIAGNNSVGYSFTANNAGVVMDNNTAYHCTSNGVFNGGADVTISNGKLYDNGLGASGGYGVQGTNAGFTNVTGTTFSSNVSGPQSTIAGYASFSNSPGIALSYTVSTLPACNSLSQFYPPVWVTDALSPTYNATLTGGGTVKTLAGCNGVSWTAH